MIYYVKKVYKKSIIKNILSITAMAFIFSTSTYILAYVSGFSVFIPSYLVPFATVVIFAKFRPQDNRTILLLFSYALLSLISFLVLV